jgi:hypothetical protein
VNKDRGEQEPAYQQNKVVENLIRYPQYRIHRLSLGSYVWFDKRSGRLLARAPIS